MEVKKCPKCGKIKELNEFSSNGCCKGCYREYKREWQSKNKAHIDEYNMKYYENNRGYYLYIICNGEEVKYVGATEHLSKRLSGHINCHNNNTKDLMSSEKWAEIRYLDITDIVANREEMLLLENVLIELYEPMYNKNMNIIKNVDKLREFSLLAEVHGLNQHWELYCKNKRLI